MLVKRRHLWDQCGIGIPLAGMNFRGKRALENLCSSVKSFKYRLERIASQKKKGSLTLPYAINLKIATASGICLMLRVISEEYIG